MKLLNPHTGIESYSLKFLYYFSNYDCSQFNSCNRLYASKNEYIFLFASINSSYFQKNNKIRIQTIVIGNICSTQVNSHIITLCCLGYS